MMPISPGAIAPPFILSNGYNSGNALLLDGVNDILTFTQTTPGVDVGSVSMQVNIASFADPNPLLKDGGVNKFISILDSTTIRVATNDNTDFTVAAMSIDAWFNIVVTFNNGGDEVKVYAAGVESSSGTQDPGGFDWRFDRFGTHGGDTFNGKVDDLLIWYNDVLTSGQAVSLAAGEDPLSVQADPDRHYKFNSTSGAVAIDSGADGENAALVNFVDPDSNWVPGFTSS